MKVGIISINMYSKGLNFACPLHTFAFQQFLTRNKIDNTVINYKPVYYDNFDLKHPYDYYNKKCEGLLEKGELSDGDKEKLEKFEKQRDDWKALYHEREIRYEKFQNFIDTKYVKTETCYDSDLLEVLDPGFDCYICATDVIWKNQPNVGYDRGFFLASKAMENKWKISYAASRGVYFANSKEEEDTFFRYIKDIDKLSVREASLKQYISENSDMQPELVLDPVLLNEKEFYDELAVKPEEEHYILLYYVMEKAKDTIREAVRYARKYNMKIVEITDIPAEGGRLQKFTDVETVFKYDIGIEEWLGYFKYADCVITNSFHACCFSILFEKEFYAGFRHGDKVANILETFGLSDRQIKLEEIKKPPVKKTLSARAIRKFKRILGIQKEQQPQNPGPYEAPIIDYGPVRQTLQKKREESAEFILSAIHELENLEKPKKDYDPYRKQIVYPLRYNSCLKNEEFTWTYSEENGKLVKLSTGTLEYTPNEKSVNNGLEHFAPLGFQLEKYKFIGWKVRIRIDNQWFWYLEDGTLALRSEHRKGIDTPVRKFRDGEQIPYIPVNHISSMIAEATWKLEKE